MEQKVRQWQEGPRKADRVCWHLERERHCDGLGPAPEQVPGEGRGGAAAPQATLLPAAATAGGLGHVGCQEGSGGPPRGDSGVGNKRENLGSVSGNFREAEPNRTLDSRELDRRPRPHGPPVRPPGRDQHGFDRAAGLGCRQIIRKRGAPPCLLSGGISEGTRRPGAARGASRSAVPKGRRQ